MTDKTFAFSVDGPETDTFTGDDYTISWDFSSFEGGEESFVEICKTSPGETSCFLIEDESARVFIAPDEDLEHEDPERWFDEYELQVYWQSNPTKYKLSGYFTETNADQPGLYSYKVTPCKISKELWEIDYYFVVLWGYYITGCDSNEGVAETVDVTVQNNRPQISNVVITDSVEVYNANSIINLAATITDQDGDQVFVDFGYKPSNSTNIVSLGGSVGGSLGSSLLGAPASGVLTNPPSGYESITLYARAQDSHMGSEWTDWVGGPTIVVNDPPSVPQIIEPIYPNLDYRYDEEITFSTTVSDVGAGSISAVQFCYSLKADRSSPNCDTTLTLDGNQGNYYSSFKWIEINPTFNTAGGDVNFYCYARAFDNHGASSTSANLLINVGANETPNVSMVSPNNNDSFFLDELSGGIEFSAAASDPDGDGIKSVTFYVNGAALSEPAELNGATGLYESNWQPLSSAAGDYSLYVNAVDWLGAEHSTASSFRTITIKSNPAAPVLLINGSENPADTSAENFELTWSVINAANEGYRVWDAIGNEELYVLDKDTQSLIIPKSSGTYRYKILACGSLVSGSVVCSDEFSNEVEIKVELLAPAPPVLAVTLPSSGENYGDYTLTSNQSPSAEQVDHYELQIKLGGLNSAEPWEWATISDPGAVPLSHEVMDHAVSELGSYTYQARACNVDNCSEWGTQLTVQVLSPMLSSAALGSSTDPECDTNCIKLAGTFLDPEGSLTVTAIHNNALLATYPNADAPLDWISANDVAVDLLGATGTAVTDALFEHMGVVLKYTNPNGANYSLTLSGDDASSYVNLIESAPIEYQGIIYVGVGNNLHALDQQDLGNELEGWPFITGGVIKSTPAIDYNDGSILVGSADNSLYAVLPGGNMKWSFLTGGDIVSTPVLDINEQGETVSYVGSMDGNLYAIETDKGDLQWLFPAGAPIADSPVTAGGGWIYVTTQDGMVQAVGRGNLGANVLVWESQDDSLLRDDLDASGWIPFASLAPQFSQITRIFNLLVQPPLNFDREIITFWTYALTQRIGIEEIVGAFLESDTGLGEFPPSLGDSEFIDLLYSRAFFNYDGSEPALHYAGVEYLKSDLMDLLAEGSSRSTIALIFIDSQEYVDATKNSADLLFELFYEQDFDWVPVPDDCAVGELEVDDFVRDCDGDLLPDYWEILYFDDLVSQRGEESGDVSGGVSWDADGDGISNLDAFDGSETPCANECLDVETPPAPAVGTVPAINPDSEKMDVVEGQFRVNEAGAATYSMPIKVVPGIAGVTPSLSLNYSSFSGNGLVGLGWSVGGISSIGRCAQNFAQDGAYRPIDYSENDRFCYNGQRLVAVQGSYGYPGTTYRTEIDANVEVIAVGGITGEPAYFEVHGKDGSVSYFGETVDSKLTVDNGNHVLSWSINKFEDSVGNPIAFNYLFDVNGQRIDSIEYAHNGSYLSRVDFVYGEERPDVSTKYFRGEETIYNQRLKAIEIVNNGSVVKSYRLSYLQPEQGELMEMSRLVQVDECTDETEFANCLEPTVFEWSLPPKRMSNSFYDYSAPAFNTEGSIFGQAADINGDGLQDYIWRACNCYDDPDDNPKYYIRSAISDGEKLIPSTMDVFELGHDHGDKWHLLDYNGDGLTDIISLRNSVWQVALSDGSGYPDRRGANSHYINTGISNINITDVALVDVNYDGLQDFVYRTNDGAMRYRLMKEVEVSGVIERYFDTVAQVLVAAGTDDKKISLSDFNGDGLLDYVRQEISEVPGEPVYDVLYPADPIIGYYGYDHFLYVNINNGDGTYTELLVDQYVSFNATGVRSNGLVTIEDTGLNRDLVVYVDYNQDGNTDIMVPFEHRDSLSADERIRWHLYLGDGESFKEVMVVDQGFNALPDFAEGAGRGQLHLLDLNQDGSSDFILGNTNKLYTWDPKEEWFVFTENNTLYEEHQDYTFALLDVTGDGHSDVIRFSVSQANTNDGVHYSTRVYQMDAGGQGTNVITNIDAGFGKQTAIQYKIMADPEVYSHDVGDAVNQAINAEWSLNDEQTLGKTAGVIDLLSGGLLVSRVDKIVSAAGAVPNAVTDQINTMSYHYAGGKGQIDGRGNLGFRELQTIDHQSGVRTTTTYRQDFPFIGMPMRTKLEATVNGSYVVVSDSFSEYEFQADDYLTKSAPYRPVLGMSKEWSFDPYSGDVTLYVETINRAEDGSSGFDEFGNLERVEVNTYGGAAGTEWLSTQVTTSEYNDSSLGLDYSQRMGRLSHTEVNHSRPGTEPITRAVDYSYYSSGPLTGMLKQEISHAETSQPLITGYEYDAVGNLLITTVTAAADKDGNQMQSRVSEVEYDSDGRYVDLTYVQYGAAAGERYVSSEVLVRNNLGIATQVKDASGVVVYLGVDRFGRTYYETASSGGDSATTSYRGAGLSCPANAQFYVENVASDGSESFTCIDSSGREIRSATIGFSGGNWYATDTEYDRLGRVQFQSLPFEMDYGTQGAASHWNTNYYADALGRLTKTDYADGTSDSILYEGLQVTTINRLGQPSTSLKSALGELTEVVDALDGKINYFYNAVGNVVKTVTTGNVLAQGLLSSEISVEMEYNHQGQKIAMSDPDKGDWSYFYNGFGELVEQNSANGHQTRMVYDVLGRMVSRVDFRDQNGATEESNTVWVYDSAPMTDELGADYGAAFGALESVVHTNTYEGSSSVVSKTFAYDYLARPYTATTHIEGVNYVETTTYDQLGRVFQQFDASGNSRGTRAVYNEAGYLSAILEAAQVNGEQRTYVHYDAMDAFGHVTEQTSGNGITTTRYFDPLTGQLDGIYSASFGSLFVAQDVSYDFDALGNLKSKTNHLGRADEWQSETFCYDDLNRLRNNQIDGACDGEDKYSYDSFGNITNKSNVGNYEYGTNAGPHAVTKVGGRIYAYDANGNLVTDTNQGRLDRSLAYTVFDKPHRIERNDYVNEFWYGADRDRYLRYDSDGTSTQKTTYVGNVEFIDRGGVLTVKRRIAGQIIETAHLESSGEVSYRELHYLLKDHLGSVDLVLSESISEDLWQGQGMSFDPWGQRRAPDSLENLFGTYSVADLFNVGGFDEVTTRGFTGHEMLDGTGFIHMNGRVYDPHLARFVSADSIIQAPGNTQSYNRYSYVFNNPLAYTDPSGNIGLPAIAWGAAAIVGSYVLGEVAAGEQNPIFGIVGSMLGCFGGNIVLCAGTAFGSTYGQTHDFGAAFIAGHQALMSGMIFGGIGDAFKGSGLLAKNGIGHIAAHAVAGGVMAAVYGVSSDFGSAFLAAGVTKAFAPSIASIDSDVVGISIPRAIVAGMIGGTVSEATGGKFANGAVAGAMAQMYNADGGGSNTQSLDDLQTTLDVAGLAPGVGNAADFANAVIDVFRGNFLGAGGKLLSMIPVVGQAATLSRLGAKGADKLNPKLIQEDPRNLIPTQTKSEISGSQVKRLSKDMKKNGFDQSKPVDAWRNPNTGRLEIQDGHHRTEAARKAGLDKIPVQVWE